MFDNLFCYATKKGLSTIGLNSPLQFGWQNNLFCTLGYYNYIRSLYSLFVVANFKLHDLTFGEGFEAFCHDACVVYKYFTTLIGEYESIPLLAVEPFNLANHIGKI